VYYIHLIIVQINLNCSLADDRMVLTMLIAFLLTINSLNLVYQSVQTFGHECHVVKFQRTGYRSDCWL